MVFHKTGITINLVSHKIPYHQQQELFHFVFAFWMLVNRAGMENEILDDRWKWELWKPGTMYAIWIGQHDKNIANK